MSTSIKAGAHKAATEPILQVRGVTKNFPGVRALKGVDLRVFPGEVHALMDFYKHTKHTGGEVVLEVRNMSDGGRWVKEASFQLRQGEVLGLAGQVGAGRTELARLAFGADRARHGGIVHLKRTAGNRGGL